MESPSKLLWEIRKYESTAAPSSGSNWSIADNLQRMIQLNDIILVQVSSSGDPKRGR
jgi:hypothetical protein